MAGHTILLNLIGGVALLLWGTHMVQAAILKGFGDEIRGASPAPPAGRCARRRPAPRRRRRCRAPRRRRCCVTGFVTRGLIALPAALALMLGADLGTTLVVQALSVDLAAAMPLLLLAGVVARPHGRAAATRAGRADADRLRADPAGARR